MAHHVEISNFQAVTLGVLFVVCGGYWGTRLLRPSSPPPRWGKGGRGCEMSRSSVVFTSICFCTMGILLLVTPLHIGWLEDRALPAALLCTVLGGFLACFRDTRRK
jgi:hypothetical protein